MKIATLGRVIRPACSFVVLSCATAAFAMAQPNNAVGSRVESKIRTVNAVPVRTHTVPALAAGESLVAVPAGLKPKNVIIAFGDGMGFGIAEAASCATRHAARAMLFDAFPVVTVCSTWSADDPITDSAASATAFACGSKTKNRCLGVLPDGRSVRSVATLAQTAGKSVGLVTNDKLEGASPSAFAAHVKNRGMAKEIFDDYAKCGFDILVGDASKPGFAARSALEGAGYSFVSNAASLAALSAGTRAFGQIEEKSFLASDTALADVARAAIARLAANTNGFILFVESTEPDHGGHANKLEQGITGVVQVDWTTRAALDYAFAHKDTLVLVFADHETGGLFAGSAANGKGPVRSVYTSAWHTGMPVPLRAYGPGEELFDRVMDNTDIARNIAALWGLSLDK